MSTLVDRNTYSLDDRYAVEDGVVYLTGTQALVRVLVEQRRSDIRRGHNTGAFVSGYPGSPLGGVDIELNRRQSLLDDLSIIHAPGLNEDLAATAVFGSQMAASLPNPTVEGVASMWFAKAPGVDRSGDAFRIANLRGVGPLGGVLVVAGDDPDAKSTIYPSDSLAAFYDWQMPILFPGDVQGILDLGLHGYALSRASGLYVGFKIPTNVAESAGTVDVGRDRISPVIPVVELDGAPFVPQVRPGQVGPSMKEAEHDLVYGRMEIARAYARHNGLNRTVIDTPNADIGIIAPGQTYFDLRRGLDLLGLDDPTLRRIGIRVMKVDVLFPMDGKVIREFADGLRDVIVVEEKRPFLELFAKDALYAMSRAPSVIGKADERGEPFLPLDGELTPEIIALALAKRLEPLGLESVAGAFRQLSRPQRELIPLSVDRTMYFCSGCPHNRSLAVPDGSVVGAGIGCHTMALVVPREEFGELTGITHMGGEGAQWIGASPFTTTEHIFQNLGDGTFHHSGSLAIRAAIAAGVNITYKILYNSTVGMTGGQDVAGALKIPELVDLLIAEGVQRIVVTTDDMKKYKRRTFPSGVQLRHRDELLKVQMQLAAVPGVTVLIHDQHCAAEKRRLRKRDKLAEPNTRVLINERVCEGCGDCGQKSNCLSVQPTETEFGRKTAIHQSSCNFDYSCLDGDCPSFLTVDTSGSKAPARKIAPAPPTDLPMPNPAVPVQSFSVHMTGIGGTGVVTTSQMLATAAVLDGRRVRNLDLTGSSQKAGPVTSTLQILDGDDRPTASTLSAGDADVLLAFDLLTALHPTNLEKASAERTVVVGSRSAVPTGEMVLSPQSEYPAFDTMRRALDAVSRSDISVYVDIQQLATQLFGTHMVANTMLLGVAFQSGALPLAVASIEQAIRLNGTAVEANLAAFRWGRAAVAQPEALPAPRRRNDNRTTVIAEISDLVASVGADASSELARLLDIRVADLVQYQGLGYARRYVDTVRSVAERERHLDGTSQDVSACVARYLYKLMAYKDEYEVARLHLEPAAHAAVMAEFGDGAKIKFNLHPPVLKSLGMKKKISLGEWSTPILRILAEMRRVRGTRFDPFGHTRVRRIERALVGQYRSMMLAAVECVGTHGVEPVVELAALPDLVRGYEDIKLANVAEYLRAVRQHTTALQTPAFIDDVLKSEELVLAGTAVEIG